MAGRSETSTTRTTIARTLACTSGAASDAAAYLCAGSATASAPVAADAETRERRGMDIGNGTKINADKIADKIADTMLTKDAANRTPNKEQQMQYPAKSSATGHGNRTRQLARRQEW